MGKLNDSWASLSNFYSTSTIHQYPHFVRGGYIRRALWFALYLGCTGLMWYAFFKELESFLKDDVQTSSSRSKSNTVTCMLLDRFVSMEMS